VPDVSAPASGVFGTDGSVAVGMRGVPEVAREVWVGGRADVDEEEEKGGTRGGIGGSGTVEEKGQIEGPG
jgi:hypothetical protein